MAEKTRRRGRRRVAVAALVLASAVTGDAAAATAATGAETGSGARPVTVTWLLGPEGERGSAYHLNDRGLVAGTVSRSGGFYNPGSTVLWQDGRPVFVGPIGARYDVLDMSNRGQAVGTVYTVDLAPSFSWKDGVTASLPPIAPGEAPAVVFSSAPAVNERGQVLLGAITASTGPQLAIWQDGEITAVAERYAVPKDLNDRGLAVVDVPIPPTGPDRRHVATLWRVGGDMTELGTLGGANSWAAAIDERGRVAGNSETAGGDVHAFVWHRGEMTDLGTLGGTTSSVGDDPPGPGGLFPDADDAVNDRGMVVGTSETADGEQHAFLWHHGEMTDLGTLGGATSHATAVNDHGQVVGYSETADGEEHAFLWQDGEMIDLGALAGPGPSRAEDINNRGQIAGSVRGDGSGAVIWTARP